MSKSQRIKGVKGQCRAAELLRSRDYHVDQLSGGISTEDLIATDPDGKAWSCEVKNTISMTHAHVKQAMEQAKKRNLPWMLMQHLRGSSSWLVRRQGMRAVVWHENGDI